MRADPEIDRVGRASPGHPRQVTEAERPSRRECRWPEALRRIGSDRSARTTGTTRRPAAARSRRAPANPRTRAHFERRPGACRADRLPATATCGCRHGRQRRAHEHGRRVAGGNQNRQRVASAFRRKAAEADSRTSRPADRCRQVRLDRRQPAVGTELQHDEVDDRDSPAIGDRRQPLEREVRVRLTRQECLKRRGRSELEGVSTGRNSRAGFGHTQPECRERESRRLRPQEDADRAPPPFGRMPKSSGNQCFSGQHRRRSRDGRPKAHQRCGCGRRG